MTARLYTTVYDPDDLPTEVAHIASKSLGTVNSWTELEYTHHRKGTGTIRGKINRYHSQAALLQQDRYVIVHSDAGPVGGGFLGEGKIDLSAEQGTGDESMVWEGPGSIIVLKDGKLLDTHYSTDPAASPFRGNVDNEGVWEWINAVAANIYYGGVLARAVEEGQDEPGNPLAVVSMWGTDGADRRVNDASGTPWTGLAEAFRTDIGTSVLDLVERFGPFGVIAQMSPLFKLDAYNEANFGTDRAGAFGPSTVRLEKDVNISASIQRKVRGRVTLTHLLVGGADYVFETVVHPDWVPGTPAHYGFLSVPETADPTDLAAIGLDHLRARDSQTDAWVLPLKHHGDDPESGIYEPAPDIADGHFWVGDTISFHTGTGEYDANEQAAPVAAITWQLKTGDEANGDYRVIVEVGSTFHWEDSESFSGGAPGSQHKVIFCPATVGVDTGTDWKVALTGTPPAGWHDAGFDDSAYSNAVHATTGSGDWYDGSSSRWVWDSDTSPEGSGEERSFRREFDLQSLPEHATVTVAADNGCEVYVNGTLVGSIGESERGGVDALPPHITDAAIFVIDPSLLVAGTNCISIIAWNETAASPGPAAVYAVLHAGVGGIETCVARGDHGHLAEALAANETDTSLVLAPDGAGGVEWSAGAGGRPSWTKLVVGSDQPAALQAIADYICDGTNDEVELNQAIADIASDTVSASVRAIGRFNLGAEMTFVPWDTTAVTDARFVFEATDATFHAAANLTRMVNIIGPSVAAGYFLNRFDIRIGSLHGESATHTVDHAIEMKRASDNHLWVGNITFVSGDGFFCDQDGVSDTGTFNNFLEFNRITDCAYGIRLRGGDNAFGFQGNIVKTGQIWNCNVGIDVGQSANKNAHWNTFIAGPVEQGGTGIVERAGGNTWIVNNTNGNSVYGITVATGITRPSMFQFTSDGQDIDPNLYLEHWVLEYGRIAGRFQSAEKAATPSTPSSGFGEWYVGSDGKFYGLNDAGTVYDLTAGSTKRWVPMTTDPANDGNWELLFTDEGDVFMSEVPN